MARDAMQTGRDGGATCPPTHTKAKVEATWWPEALLYRFVIPAKAGIHEARIGSVDSPLARRMT